MTLLGQSLGSVFLAWEAMCRFFPDVFIGVTWECYEFQRMWWIMRADTMGYAFTFTLIRWLNLRPITTLKPLRRDVVSMPIGAYVHYPTISTNMLSRVKNRETGVTNSASITSSGWKTSLKLSYVTLRNWFLRTLTARSFQILSSVCVCIFVFTLMRRWNCCKWDLDKEPYRPLVEPLDAAQFFKERGSAWKRLCGVPSLWYEVIAAASTQAPQARYSQHCAI